MTLINPVLANRKPTLPCRALDEASQDIVVANWLAVLHRFGSAHRAGLKLELPSNGARLPL
jgi:hypothetical protein